jgi:hypothetical protein
LREAEWEARLDAAAKALGLDLADLGLRKSSADKVRLAALLRATTAVSNGWLAQRLAMGRPASVSQFVRRFHLSGGAEAPAFRVALSRVEP